MDRTKAFWAKCAYLGVKGGLLGSVALPSFKLPARADAVGVDAWWPKAGVQMTGVQPFKAALAGRNVNEYRMTWRVDGGAETTMYDSYQDYPHKEATVDVSGWNWKGSGPYAITYTAYEWDGTRIDSSQTDFSVGSAAPAVATATPAETPAAVPGAAGTASPTPTPAPVAKSVTTSVKAAPVTGSLYVNPDSPAARQADQWRTSRPADASVLDKIASGGGATWFGGWNSDVRGDVDRLMDRASGKTAVLVAYNIPSRDCGSYSAGGAPAGAYAGWIQAFAGGLQGRPAIVVLEPDALAQIGCLSSGDRSERYRLLSDAVATLKAAGARVYLDAGHANWIAAADMAARLKAAGIDRADGFALNVSNFQTTPASQSFGHALSLLTGGKHFVVDTSRNGNGTAAGDQWCNPSGRALGVKPTTNTNDPLADAYLWLKTPGESDGTCNGGPSAGNWWPEYALGLAQRAGW